MFLRYPKLLGFFDGILHSFGERSIFLYFYESPVLVLAGSCCKQQQKQHLCKSVLHIVLDRGPLAADRFCRCIAIEMVISVMIYEVDSNRQLFDTIT